MIDGSIDSEIWKMVIYNRILQQLIRFKKEKMGDPLVDVFLGFHECTN